MRFGSIWMHNRTGIICIFGAVTYTMILVFGEDVEIKFTMKQKIDAKKHFIKEFSYIGEE